MGAKAPLPQPPLPPTSRSVQGDGRFLHGNLGELMASSTESGLGYCCSPARTTLCCCCGVGGDGDGDCSSSRQNVLLAPLPAGVVVVVAATGQTSDAEAARISAARTAAMIRRSVLRSSSHFSSAPSSFRRFSAAVSGAAGAGGGGGGRVGRTTGRGAAAAAAGEGGADSSRPMRRAMMAGGGGRGLSQLERRCSGAIVGLRGASQERRRRTVTAVVVISCCIIGFTGEAGAGEAAEVCWAWAAAFFLGGEDDGVIGSAWGESRAAALFLAVRRFRWWLRWYGEMRRRRPAMHPMPLLRRLGAVEHVEDARRLAGSGCGCGGCIALCVP